MIVKMINDGKKSRSKQMIKNVKRTDGWMYKCQHPAIASRDIKGSYAEIRICKSVLFACWQGPGKKQN